MMKLNDVIFAGYSKVYEHNITKSLLVHTWDTLYRISISKNNLLFISDRKCKIDLQFASDTRWKPLDIKGFDELQAHILIKML